MMMSARTERRYLCLRLLCYFFQLMTVLRYITVNHCDKEKWRWLNALEAFFIMEWQSNWVVELMRGASSFCFPTLIHTDISAVAWLPAGSRWTRKLSCWLLANEKRRSAGLSKWKNIIDISPQLLFILPILCPCTLFVFQAVGYLLQNIFGVLLDWAGKKYA